MLEELRALELRSLELPCRDWWGAERFNALIRAFALEDIDERPVLRSFILSLDFRATRSPLCESLARFPNLFSFVNLLLSS